mmetsp:Transcript_60764/g.144726  ORF Transcript_60764/g.144726 Transcript_60764/m.144726 type:complete len:244 (-) Transcript_60764:80-811(-)
MDALVSVVHANPSVIKQHVALPLQSVAAHSGGSYRPLHPQLWWSPATVHKSMWQCIVACTAASVGTRVHSRVTRRVVRPLEQHGRSWNRSGRTKTWVDPERTVWDVAEPNQPQSRDDVRVDIDHSYGQAGPRAKWQGRARRMEADMDNLAPLEGLPPVNRSTGRREILVPVDFFGDKGADGIVALLSKLRAEGCDVFYDENDVIETGPTGRSWVCFYFEGSEKQVQAASIKLMAEMIPPPLAA